MTPRTKRLKKLVEVQNQMKALHERRYATHLALAREADEEAAELVRRFEAEDGLGTLFPEIYHGRIAQAAERRTLNLERADAERNRVLAATLRADAAEDAWRNSRRADERAHDDRERLEEISRKAAFDRNAK